MKWEHNLTLKFKYQDLRTKIVQKIHFNVPHNILMQMLRSDLIRRQELWGERMVRVLGWERLGVDDELG